MTSATTQSATATGHATAWLAAPDTSKESARHKERGSLSSLKRHFSMRKATLRRHKVALGVWHRASMLHRNAAQ